MLQSYVKYEAKFSFQRAQNGGNTFSEVIKIIS